MDTLELKNILVTEILKIDDDSFLPALNTILDNRKTSSKVYPKQYNKEIKIAEQDIENGNSYSHNEIKDKIQQWKKK